MHVRVHTHLSMGIRLQGDVLKRLQDILENVLRVFNTAGIAHKAIGDGKLLTNVQWLVIIPHHSDLLDEGFDSTEGGADVRDLQSIHKPVRQRSGRAGKVLLTDSSCARSTFEKLSTCATMNSPPPREGQIKDFYAQSTSLYYTSWGYSNQSCQRRVARMYWYDSNRRYFHIQALSVRKETRYGRKHALNASTDVAQL